MTPLTYKGCETPLVYEYAWSDLSVIGAPEAKEHNPEPQLRQPPRWPCIFDTGIQACEWIKRALSLVAFQSLA